MSYRADNKVAVRLIERKSRLRKQFGITNDDYEKLLSQQDGRCAICTVNHNGKHLYFAIDHCHNTGAIRGLLCKRCNAGLGMFGDNPKLMRIALAYLTRGT